MPMTDEARDRFLAEPLIGVLGTVDASGQPHQAPIWYLWEDGAAYLVTGRSSRKWRNAAQNPRVSLCIDARTPPYRAVLVSGRAEEAAQSVDEMLLRLAMRYLGDEGGRNWFAASRAGGGSAETSLVVRIRPERIVSWDDSSEV